MISHLSPMSSSSVVFPSALHSYSKRRFISPFAPPCYPWLSLLILGRGVGKECCIPPVFSGAFSWMWSGVGPEPSQIIFFNSTVQDIVLEVVVVVVVQQYSSSSSSSSSSNFLGGEKTRVMGGGGCELRGVSAVM